MVTAQKHIPEIYMAVVCDFNQYMAILTLHLLIILTAGLMIVSLLRLLFSTTLKKVIWAARDKGSQIIIFMCIWPLA